MSVIAKLVVVPMHKGGEQVECPVCGQWDNLTLVIVAGDFSETPSTMHCDDMHEWAEVKVPRRIGAELFAIREREAPETIVDAEDDRAGWDPADA